MDHIREAVELAKKSRPAGQSLPEKPLAGSQINLAGISHLTSHPGDPARCGAPRIEADYCARHCRFAFAIIRHVAHPSIAAHGHEILAHAWSDISDSGLRQECDFN